MNLGGPADLVGRWVTSAVGNPGKVGGSKGTEDLLPSVDTVGVRVYSVHGHDAFC